MGEGWGSRQQRQVEGRERRKRRTIFDAFVDIDIHVIFSFAIRIGVET